MQIALEIVLSEDGGREFLRLLCTKQTSVRAAQRARIMLLPADGKQNKEIAVTLGISRVHVACWHGRYRQQQLAEIERDLLYGAPLSSVDVARVVELTTKSTPEAASHLSTRTMTMTPKLGVSAASASRHWRANVLKSHPAWGFKVSLDLKLTKKLENIVGLYPSPPENALMLCCDEKSQIPVFDRFQTKLLLKNGRAATITHDYKSNGTTSLFTALNVLDGQATAQCQSHHRHIRSLKFLRQIERETPKGNVLRLIADNYATHKFPKVKSWIGKHPRFTMHYTSTSASLLNMVERFFLDITTERICRGVFSGVPEFIADIDDYNVHHNVKPKPFVWTMGARDNMQKVMRANRRLSSKHYTSRLLFEACGT